MGRFGQQMSGQADDIDLLDILNTYSLIHDLILHLLYRIQALEF